MVSAEQVEHFCRAYTRLGNATQAYIEARPRAARWQRKSAARKAVDMMRRPDVLARIEELADMMRRQSERAFLADLEREHEESRRESREWRAQLERQRSGSRAA